MVEHLKVRVYLLGGGLMVEPACASLTVEPACAFNLLIGPSNKSKNGRAPKGDGGLISRACLRILISRAP